MTLYAHSNYTEVSVIDEGIRETGEALVRYANEDAEFSAQRGLTEQLFPYIYAASKRMSTRAISQYLEQVRKVKLSAATIAKALREQDRHWEALCEEIEPAARLLADDRKLTMWQLLCMNAEDFERDHATDPRCESPNSPGDDEVADAYRTLSNRWFGLVDEAAMNRCRKYFEEEEAE